MEDSSRSHVNTSAKQSETAKDKIGILLLQTKPTSTLRYVYTQHVDDLDRPSLKVSSASAQHIEHVVYLDAVTDE